VTTIDKSNHWHRLLLGACGEWPSGRRAADKHDELTPLPANPQGSGCRSVAVNSVLGRR
jgi:hypothetical protein